MAEQIRKSDVVQGEPFNEIAKEMQAAILVLERFDTGVRNVAKSMELVSKESKTTVQGINNITQAEKESAKLVQQKVANDKTLEKMRLEEIRINKAREKSIDDYNKKLAREEKQAKDSANAYKILERATREHKNESKRLGAELLRLEANGQKNTKAFKALEMQYRQTTHAAQRGDVQLKKLDATVGDNFRKVGTYENALNKLNGAMGSLGLAFGIGSAVTAGVKTIAGFETQIADLSAVTGQTGKDLEFLENKAIEFSKGFGVSAASIAEAFKLAGSARPELLQNGAALADLTEKAIILSKASGDDVPTSIKNLTGTLNAFELPATAATKVMDTLANAAQLGAQEIPYLTEGFTKFGAIAKSSNISVAESAAAMELLGQKIPDAATAGTGLRNVMLKLLAPDALGADAQKRLKELGVNFSDLSDKSKPFNERLAALKPLLNDGAALVKTFGTENAVAAQILISQTDELAKFTAGLDKNGTAQDQASTKSKTLAEAWGRLKAQVEAVFLDFRSASSGLSGALDFVAENLENIVSLTWQLIKVFGAYKAVTMALNLKEQYTNWRRNAQAIKENGDNLSGASDKAQRFGSVLKGIGWAVAINLAFELVAEIWNIARGADAATRAVENMNKAITNGNKSASERLQKLRDEVGLGIKTEAQMKQQVKAEIKLMNAEKAATKEKIKALEQDQRYQAAISKNAFFRSSYEERLIRRMESYKKEVFETNAELTAFNAELTSLTITERQNEQAAAISETTTKIKDDTKAKKENNEQTFKAIELLERESAARESLFDPEEVERLLLLDEERAVVVAEIAVKEAEIALLRAQQAGDTTSILKAEEQLTKAKIDAINAQLKLDLATETDPAKRILLEKKAAKEIIELNKTVTNSFKERADMMNSIQQAITDALQEQIDKRIALLQKESDAAKSQQDYLMALAENGNITAQQSIAEQIEIQREAQAEQMRLEKQKQNLELISQGLSTFNAQIAEGKSPGEALASTIVSTQALVGFLKNLNFYAKGTDHAPGGMAVVDEQGPEIITDSKGRIKDVGTGEGARFVNLSKGDKVITATKTAQILNAFGGMANANMIGKGKDSVGNSYDIMKLNSGLNRIEQAIKNKPEYQVHWDTFGTVERVRKGGDVVTNRYRVRP
jgi:TP901 family phage tail tape measure protein